MKKNVKILGAAAAALLAVAPVVASATTVNADFHIQPGTTTSTSNVVPLSLDISMNATGGSTTAADAANSVKISSGIGTVNRASDSKVSIIDDQGSTVTGTLQPGTAYRVEITNVSINGLTNNVKYDLGQATFQEDHTDSTGKLTPTGKATSTATGSDLVGPGTLTSAPFYLVKPGDPTQPYFYNKGASSAAGNQLSNGQVAYVGKNGEGVNVTNLSAQGILDAATGSVGVQNGEITTTADDISSQLAEQNVALSDGKYVLPVNGFHVTLTAVNHSSNRSVTVVVPFAGSVNNYEGYPTISVKQDFITNNKDDFSSDFKDASSKGVQSKPASDLTRKVDVNSNFDSNTALAPFQAVTDKYSIPVDLAVLSNPVNTRVPGRYTVTVQATDWSTGKTSRLSYTVQVGDSDATYQTVNYPAAYGINIWSIAGNTVSFTGQRQAGQSSVATYDTRTVNGTSYTRIGKADSNTWVPTSFLGNHSSNTNKPSNNNGEKAISGVARVTYNGKGAVKLLNADGRHVEQYVQKGSSWKVWAEKTVNGVHMYRIGNQSQWVPAMYVTLN
ncbi:MAG: hypothetical protein ACFN0Y_00830 [Lactobacillus sp.]